MQAIAFTLSVIALCLAVPSNAEPPTPAQFRVPPGWRVKTLRGEELRYCRKEVTLGSRFAKEECLTRDQLELKIKVDAENAARAAQSAQICTSALGCANN
ncbi:MAG: hypothetical protein FGM43_11365 [Sinobacteraceae bacterium]|nr:hypothetical protein [Nevskiaceae bacterium]